MEKLTCPADTKAAKVIKEAYHHFQCFLQILGKGLTRPQLSQWISRWWPLPDSAAKWGHTGWPERTHQHTPGADGLDEGGVTRHCSVPSGDISPIKPHCITSQMINISHSLRSYYNSQSYTSSESCLGIKMLSKTDDVTLREPPQESPSHQSHPVSLHPLLYFIMANFNHSDEL